MTRTTGTKERNALLREGHTPRTTPWQDRVIARELRKGTPWSKIATLAKVSESTIARRRKSLGDLESVRAKRAAEPPEPIPYEELGATARASIEPTRAGFHLFRTHYLKHDDPPWCGIAAEELLTAYESPDDEHVVLNIGPGFGKTTMLYAFVAWVIARERAMGREPRIQLGHRAEQKAKWYVRRLKNLLERNHDLIWDFGRFKPENVRIPWSQEEFMVEPLVWEDQVEKEPTVSSASYEASVLSGRYSLILWDDLLDKYNQNTPEARDKTAEWWWKEAETRLEPGGLLVLSNARFGPEDLSHTLSEQVSIDDVEAGIAEPRHLYRRIRFRSHYPDHCNGVTHKGPYPNGCLLDPKRGAWARLRHFMSAGDEAYALVWDQEDVDPKGSLAEKVWFDGGEDREGHIFPGCFDEDRSFGQLPPEGNKAYRVSAMTVDMAPKKHWALMHFVEYPGDRSVVIEARNRPMTSPEFLEEQRDHTFTGVAEEWWRKSVALGVPIRYLIVETVAAERFILQHRFWLDWLQARSVILIRHDTHRNKTDPIMGVSSQLPRTYREGRVRIPYQGWEEQQVANEWRREACAWPNGQRQDMPMAHWFYKFKLPHLAVAELADRDRPEPNVPDWVKRRFQPGNLAVPGWVSKRATVQRARNVRWEEAFGVRREAA